VIGLIDVDSKLPNLALEKISSYYKSLGEPVEFVREGGEYSRIYASAIFTRSQEKCEKLLERHGPSIQIGGTGWDIKKVLPPEIDRCKSDYDLYTAEMIAPRILGIKTTTQKQRLAKEIVSAGVGFTSRGCVRNCPFCVVPRKEGPLRQDQEIKDIINPRSNVIILHDNNFTADPFCIDKLHEIRDRGLKVDINQGIDIRFMTDEIGKALSEVKHLRSVHYAWDLMKHEEQVLRGIRILDKYIKVYRHMCYILVGFNTTYEEDAYRVRRLQELGVRPYVMRYNNLPDTRLKHYARWINAFFYKSCTFEEYKPWRNELKRASVA